MRTIYFLLAALLGLRLTGYFLVADQKYMPGSVVSIQTVLDREPEVAMGRQVFRVAELIIYAPLVPELHFGDKVEVSGLIECSKRGQDCSRMGLYKPEVKIIMTEAANPWMAVAFTVRSRFREIYQTSLNREEADLLSGIVLGSVGLDRQFKDKLANVGLTHVVAASGMNISLFSGFVLWWLAMVKLGRGYKVILTIIMILFYSTITGFEPPIVRAMIMAVVSLAGLLLGRQRTGLMALLLSAYLMLWVSPRLLGNASFLLSFSAMAGQIILSGFSVALPISRGVIMDLISFLIKDWLQSLAAILATFPIVLVFFAKFSLVSLFTNILVLWTVEPLMAFGAIAGILGTIWSGLARIVLMPTGVLLSFVLAVVEVFGKDERFLLRISGLDWTFVFGYYLALAGLVLWWREKRPVVAGLKKLM